MKSVDAQKRILVLFDDLNVRQEAIQYSIALAQRINGLLMPVMFLSENTADGNDTELLKSEGEESLQEMAETARKNNIHLKMEVRTGDPRSEFYKFMAGQSVFHASVWGGCPDVLRSGTGVSKHWVARIRDELPCPLVIPFEKRKE